MRTRTRRKTSLSRISAASTPSCRVMPMLIFADHDSHRGASDTYYGQPQEAYGSHQQPAFGQQPGHSPQPQHQYGGPPPPQAHDGPPASGPQLPPGWLQQWDTNSQRYYYLEQATGRSQWEPPAMHGPPGDQQRGYGVPPASMTSYGQHGHSAQGYPPPTGLAYSGGEKKSNKGGMLAAGAGGLALGGLAGAALAHDSDSDDGMYLLHAAHTFSANCTDRTPRFRRLRSTSRRGIWWWSWPRSRLWLRCPSCKRPAGSRAQFRRLIITA